MFASGGDSSNEPPTQTERITDFNNFIPYAGDGDVDDDGDTAMPDADAFAPPPSSFPFLRLPRELRDHIYTSLAIAAGHYYETAGLFNPYNPYRHADIAAIPTLPSLISSRYLSGLLLASHQLRHEALAAIHAAPVGLAIAACAYHGDTVRSDRGLPGRGQPEERRHHAELSDYGQHLQALSYTVPRTVLGLHLVRMLLGAGWVAYGYAPVPPVDDRHGAWAAVAPEGLYWPRKLECAVLRACPRLRQLVVAVEGDGGCQWRALAEELPYGVGAWASAAGFWVGAERWEAEVEIVNEALDDDDDWEEEDDEEEQWEDEEEEEYYGEDPDCYSLKLSLTRRPRAASMLSRHRDVAGLLAWVPPVQSQLREYSVVVRQNLGMPVLDIARKVERRRVLGTPFRSERWSLDLTFWEVVWDWLVMAAKKRRKRRRMVRTLVSRGMRPVSQPSRSPLPTVFAAELTICAEDVYYAWVHAGKPSAKEIIEGDLDMAGGPLFCLFELDIA